ncbi:MAG: prolyl oligopeptidase family serine peptidase [Acidobacteria bacterium]|nr:prolyl oligopeptidase family serine peptidase [Acidobacteriota bacterium]
MCRLVLLSLLLLPSAAQARVDKDVVYGMRSGLALLMDVHYPDRSNGRGIVFIPGSGWHAPLEYSATPLKESGFAKLWAPPLVKAGYTVFVINHRAAPRFQHPAALEDAQRAVRFVRAHAVQYGIDPNRIGGVGGSSGGHLIAMLGVADAPGNPDSRDPVERESGKLQVILARAAPTNLTKAPGASQASYMGLRLHERDGADTPEFQRYWEASPAAHASPDDAPFLLIHGDADDRVPYERSVEFQDLLTQMGVEAELLRVPGGGHGASFPGAKNPPNYLGAMVSWFDRKLADPKAKPGTPAKPAPPSPKVERDVVFGMVSGGALLMDVYRPEKPNGFAVLHITGSGWHSSLSPGAAQQKASAQVKVFGLPLVEAGYTVFAVNHRTAPWHKYPAQLEDVERAVRFIRHNAARWGVDPERLGGVGGSSGGHLTAMLGLHDGDGDPDDPDPVNRLSAKLQCILPWAPPVDLIAMNGQYGNPTFASWLGMRLMANDKKTTAQYRMYHDASPIHLVSKDDPPTLIIHGDADEGVPIAQSQALAAKLKAVGVPVEVIPVPGGGHGAQFPGKRSDSPDYIGAMVEWFDKYLKR